MFSIPLLDINKPLTNSILYPDAKTPSKSGCPLYCPFVFFVLFVVKEIFVTFV